eukprot:scaffold70552_cov47-Attheya_sp.AAC.3
MGFAALLVSLLASSSTSNDISRWSHRTAKRRQKAEHILQSIELGPPPPIFRPASASSKTFSYTGTPIIADDIPTLASPRIDWNCINPALDPVQGGKLRPDTPRGARKRAQVEAFTFVVSSILLHHRQTCIFADMNTADENEHSIRQAVAVADVDISTMEGEHNNNNGMTKKGTTIIDAGCGAGNLAIPLAGLLLPTYCSEDNSSDHHDVNVLAVDVNEIALQRLRERVDPPAIPTPIPVPVLPIGALRTVCADLADANDILGGIPPERDVIVVSLHACGAASDMAMNLAYQRGAPFVVCPCCTAKSLTRRNNNNDNNNNKANANDDGYAEPSASVQRSGATADIHYPRSEWLRANLSSPSSSNEDDAGNNTGTGTGTYTTISMEERYRLLSKVADVGLGPQTPTEQREQQRRAKQIVELDRLAHGSEQHGYDVRLVRIRDHDPAIYGKGELLMGARKGSVAAEILNRLPIIIV